MADFTVSRFGQSNATGDARALFLTMFAGEVFTSFKNATIFESRHRVKTISSGKSYQFPGIGTTTAGYHTPGVEMTGTAINSAQRLVHVDNLMKSDVSVANIDELISHFDVRGPYAAELGAALALKFDANVCRAIIRAARSPSVLTSGGNAIGSMSGASGMVNSTGNAVSGVTPVEGANWRAANASTTAGVLTTLIWNAIRRLDEVNATNQQRFLALAPAQFYMLLSNKDGSGVSQMPLVIHKDISGSGSYASGDIGQIGSVQVLKTNQMPSTDLKADSLSAATGGNSYGGNFVGTTAVMWQEQAVGTVSLQDIAAEAEYSAARQATLLIAKYVRGTGILRPESAVEIVDTTLASVSGAPLFSGNGNQTLAHLVPA